MGVFLGQGEEIREDDDYFTCITKAFENLCTSNKRKAFDSVDPLFDDDIPGKITYININRNQRFREYFICIAVCILIFQTLLKTIPKTFLKHLVQFLIETVDGL